MFMPIKDRVISDLNQVLVKKNPNRVAGMLEAANWLNEQSDIGRNGYWVGDILLLKHNLITKRQMRKQRQ